MAPNPEAIAWYLKRSEDLVHDLRGQVQSLRTRGGQIAGFSGAILALAGANSVTALDSLSGVARGGAGISLMLGALSLVLSLVIALRGSLVAGLASDGSAEEIANFASERFTNEPDLWRVHIRTIRATRNTIEESIGQGNQMAKATRRAETFFLVGLFSVGVSFATVIAEVIL
ncbi:MAG TPA: hypothetical protein VJL81_11845 [Solirubrobacterales bacterium]|nr:hypothetical protein [Solirubrobacterales bacterium]